MDTAAKIGLDALNTTSKNVFHKADEAAGEFIGDKYCKNDKYYKNGTP